MDEQEAYNRLNLGYLHLYPHVPNPRVVDESDPLQIGVNYNGTKLGITDRQGLLAAVDALADKHLTGIAIHHAMGFDIQLIDRLLELGGRHGRFWLHDGFSICPNYVLLRNDEAYCGAPDSGSNACLICKYGELRRKQQPAFGGLFEANALEVVAPSQFMLDFWREKSTLRAAAETVAPHLSLKWVPPLPGRRPEAALRIGFPGYPVHWKGWDTWLRLVERFRHDDRYQFFHLSSWSENSPGMTPIGVSVTKGDRLAMVNALSENEIDVAFLWSLCPEPFSFTLYESLAAGCYALTYKDSGNIQAYLRQDNKRGLVIDDEEALFALFAGQDLGLAVQDYRKRGRPQAQIVVNPGIEH
jgi:hypothetical protein